MYFNVVSIVLIRAAVAMKTVTMEVTQPSTAGPVCPGQEVILTCTVTQTRGNTENIILGWILHISNSLKIFQYQSDYLHVYSGPVIFGDYITNAELVNTTNSTDMVSNMTLKSAAFENNNNRIYTAAVLHMTFIKQ